MKIVGLTYNNGSAQMYLKPDTALLVNNKPFFLPHFTEEVEGRPCLIAKISRMGRHISPKFASRYYEQTAPAICFIARGMEQMSSLNQTTCAMAFDNSMAVGQFSEKGSEENLWALNDNPLKVGQLIEHIDNAVAQVSNYITLRTGDMVAVDFLCDSILLQREMIITAKTDYKQVLFCKIK